MSPSDSGAEISHPGSPDESYSGWVGRTIDERYRIDGLLGEGGMGAVFEAEHLKLRKKVALKVIHPEFAGDGEVAERFAREAMASAQLEHPHVATATDYGTLPEGGAYLVMQFVRGDSVRAALDKEGGLGWIRACEIVAQVADALSSAHKAGIVHRDLKPENVMLEPRDDGSWLVKVLDFGIARVSDDARGGRKGPALTRVGTVIGTPGYMAPEQALGEEIDFRVDIYALGLLIFEVASGVKVFDLEDLTAIVTRQLTEDVPLLSTHMEVPQELDDLVSSALRRDRDARPESAAEVRDVLRNLVLGATFQAVASGEQPLPAIGTTELGGASRRDPTPLGVKVGRPKPIDPPRRAGAVATARTALAAGTAIRKSVEKQGVPVRLIGAGCGALLALTLVIGLGVAAFGEDDEIGPGLEKNEHVGTVVPSDDVPGGEEPPPEATPARTVPSVLSQAYADLLLSERAQTRRRASRLVLAHDPRTDVPEYVVELAGLEGTSVCNRRRPHVVRLGEIGDVRAMPALERIDAEPRNACRRMFRRYDCYGCLRDELATALESLRSGM